MSKLQSIKRTNGSIVHSTYLPKEEVEKVGWEKGDNLEVKASGDSLVITKSKEEE